MNKTNLINFFFLVINIPFYLLLICIFFLLTFEYFGISKKIIDIVKNKENVKVYELHETDYYKKNGLKKDPYNEFVKQILHPYYIFGLPWNVEEIKKINNSYISLNKMGFRDSLRYKNKKDGIILLGGSVAFSHGSSSDSTTISSLLSKNTAYNSISKGTPSWNSHQEMVSFIKSRDDSKYVISLSANNDFSLACSSPSYYSTFYDIPESFFMLQDVFYDLRGKYVTPKNIKLKKFLLHNFPETAKLYKIVLVRLNPINRYNDITETNINNNLLNNSFCGGLENVDKLVDNFLYNQRIVRNIANYNNKEHWLIIQPMLKTHVTEHSKIYKTQNDLMDIKTRYYYVNKIINSDFCKKRCLDYSNLFDQYVSSDIVLYSDKKDKTWPSYTIFTDDVHLTDLGNKILSNRMIDDISFN